MLSVQLDQRFGRGVIIDPEVRVEYNDKSKKSGKSSYRGARLACDCGNEYTAIIANLFKSLTRSCGCLQRETIAQISTGQTWSRKAPGVAARNRVLNEYQGAAKRRGHTWGLTEDDFDKLVSMDCFYCGISPGRSAVSCGSYEGSEFVCNGIDRKDNTFGYTLDNTVSCCKICNIAKNDMPLDKFLAWIARLTAHQAQFSGKRI